MSVIVRLVMSQASLFDPSSLPSFSTSVDVVSGSMFLETATALCVIGVALLGFAMLTGRFHVRKGFGVVVGCFLVLGAPSVAAGLVSMINPSHNPSNAKLPPSPLLPDAREGLQPATKDPYAGA